MLRLIAWLSLGLLLWASAPHVHPGRSIAAEPQGHGRHGATEGATEGATKGATAHETPCTPASLVADDHHEEHSAQNPGHAHPCGLCRSAQEHPLARTTQAPVLAAGSRIAAEPYRDDGLRAWILTALAPVRGPPQSA